MANIKKKTILNDETEFRKFVVKSFTKVDQRFEKVDQRFEKVDQRFEKMDQRFEKMDQRFEKMDQRFGSVDLRVGGIDQRLERLEETMADKNDINDLMNKIDAYAHKADGFFQETVMMSQEMKRHEKWIQQLAKKTGSDAGLLAVPLPRLKTGLLAQSLPASFAFVNSGPAGWDKKKHTANSGQLR